MVREGKVCCSTVHVLYYSSHLSGFFSASRFDVSGVSDMFKKAVRKKNHIGSLYASESVAVIMV